MKWIASIAALAALTLTAQASDEQLAKGKEIYDTRGACASCHGPEGKGDGAAAAALNPKPRNFAAGDYKYDTDGDGKTGTAKDIANIISKGAAAYGGSMLMVARPDITGEDLDALVAYVLSLHKEG
ncbi:MAG: cytochrome c [Verrucomicrobia bacterium]|nr:MAG: cytochrome c [Verrucomicrobiota bacterium]